MESCEGSYHDYSGLETRPETVEPDLPVDFVDVLHSAAFGLYVVQLGDHRVRWMGDYRADDSRKVARGKCNRKLCGFIVLAFGLGGENARVEKLDYFLEKDELGNRVGNLPSPERSDSFVEGSDSLFGDYFIHGRNQSCREGSLL